MCPIFQYIVVSQKTGLAWLVLLITCWFLKKIHTFIQSFTHICLIIQLVNLTLNKHLSVTFTKLILLHSPLWNRMKISVSSFPLQHQRAGKFSGPHWEQRRRKLHEFSSKCFFGCSSQNASSRSWTNWSHFSMSHFSWFRKIFWCWKRGRCYSIPAKWGLGADSSWRAQLLDVT